MATRGSSAQLISRTSVSPDSLRSIETSGRQFRLRYSHERRERIQVHANALGDHLVDDACVT